MSHYWKRCPHCGRTVEGGYGLPTQSLGNPHKLCRYCSNTYTDRSIIDWKTAPLFRKFLFCFGNGRFLLCLVLYIIASARLHLKVDWESWQVNLACLPIFIISFAICVLYVKLKVKLFYDGFFPYHADDDTKKISLEKQYEKYKDDPFCLRQPNKRNKNENK